MWGAARAFAGGVLLRLEDHDRVRSKREFEEAILEDLEWLGFRPDEKMTRQSDRGEKYEAARLALEERGVVYACACSRKTIEEVSGPSTGELRYPGTCRDARVDGAAERARRVRLEEERISFRDLRLGPLEQIPANQAGDILVRDRLGHWTYQFAVVVDDLDQGVDMVIRGEDLVGSTGRQIQLARLLGRRTPPLFLHHPLILRADGTKLSKSNRDTGVRDLRAAGWSVERVLGAAAAVFGLTRGEPATLNELTLRLREAA